MTLGFHYEDRPPQLWLDELHNFQILRLWDAKLNATQRGNLMTRAKQQLKDWRINLNNQMKKIEARYDKTGITEMRQMLAPYRKLDSLGVDLIDAMQDLEARIAKNRPLPDGVTFGDRIFGSLETGRWHFGSNADAKRWEEFEKLERRYLGLAEEYKTLHDDVQLAVRQAKDYESDIRKQMKMLKTRKGFWQIGLRLFIVIVTAIFCIVLGTVTFIYSEPFIPSIGNQAFGGIMLVLGVVAAIVAFVLVRRRRKSIKILEEDIASLKLSYRELKGEAQRKKQLFYPTQTTFKQINADYQRMKKTFEAL